MTVFMLRLDLREVFDEPQARHRRLHWQDPYGNDHICLPIRFTEEPVNTDPGVARAGEHNRQVSSAYGFSESAFQAIQDSGMLHSH